MQNSIDFYVLSSGNMNALNGAAKFVKIFSENKKYFNDNGINLTVISNSSYFSSETEYRKTLKYSVRHFLNKLASKSKIGSTLKFYYRLVRQGKPPVDEFSRIIDNDKAIVLLNDFFVAYEFYKRFGRKYKTIFMLHNNGDMLSMIGGELLGTKAFKSKLYKMRDIIADSSDKFVCVAKPAVEYFLKIHEKSKDKAVYIPIGQKSADVLDTRKYDKLRLVSVGTVCERKNQTALLEALNNISDKTIELTLVGGGPMLDKCKKYVEQNNIQEQVNFVGAQTDVVPFLKNANVYIMSSTDEGLPISAQEAMNYGLPLILTDVGGCSELISENGILTSTDLNEITEAIVCLNDNKDMLKKMGETSKRIFEERYTLDVMLGKYVQCISDILSD